MQVYDAVEVFSGVATLTRCLQLADFETASLDVQHWAAFIEQRKSQRLRKVCKGNPLDLLSPAGFAFLDTIYPHHLQFYTNGACSISRMPPMVNCI